MLNYFYLLGIALKSETRLCRSMVGNAAVCHW